MINFLDVYQNKVMLAFEKHPFSKDPKHVFVICRYNEKWLLTKHSDRGLEFPGGKVEKGETPEKAAVREVREETGGFVSKLAYLGQYQVEGKERMIVKNIYFAEVAELKKQSTYFETDGPVVLQSIPKDIMRDQRFSFIMRDEVLYHSMKKVQTYLKDNEY